LKCDEKEKARDAPFQPESPYVIVCEGFQDTGFVCAFLKHLGINNCDVTFPKTKRDGCDGESGIPKMVQLVAGIATVEGIAIIRDADMDADDSFRKACIAFEKPYDIPDESFVVKKGRHKRTGVFIMPGKGKTGAVEHLLLEAAFTSHPPLAKCVKELETCNQYSANWSENKKAKMRMQCVIASFCRANPGCSLGYIWRKGADNPLDIASPAFKELADFLTTFSTP
jgi:hypothetical protein